MAGGQRFEQETVSRLKRLGWEAETTAVTGDWGADVVAHVGSERLVVQCKDYGCPVGVAAVQEVAYARTHYGAQLAVVVARNGYTKAARRAASTVNVALLDIDDLHVGVTWLDRSIEGARQREEVLSAAWREYDFECKRFRSRRLIARLATASAGAGMLWLAVGIAAASFDRLSHQVVAEAMVGGIVIVVIGAAIALGVSRPRPEPPAEPRRSAIRGCPRCGRCLRVEVGRSGRIRCPHCGHLFRADT